MEETTKPVDVYYDMEIAEICQHFSKSRNTVDKAVAKLVRDYPNAGYKYKNEKTRRITIKAEGVEKLSKYFRKQKHEVSTVEVELRYENEKLKAILEEKEKSEKQIEILYKQRLAAELERSRQSFLLENKTKDEQIKTLTAESNQKDETIAELKQETNDKDVQIGLLKNDNETKTHALTQMSKDKETLASENQDLKAENSQIDFIKKELEEIKRKEAEYNSKSFFYRLIHKL